MPAEEVVMEIPYEMSRREELRFFKLYFYGAQVDAGERPGDKWWEYTITAPPGVACNFYACVTREYPGYWITLWKENEYNGDYEPVEESRNGTLMGAVLQTKYCIQRQAGHMANDEEPLWMEWP